jgi:2-oxoglutarate dehydrogenase E2 component (dihydrolipoamide succinyltransferase)
VKHPIRLGSIDPEPENAILVEWLIQIGDRVEAGHPLVEVDVDKVVIEIPAPVSGILVETTYDIDEELAPGSILGYIDDAP